MQESTALKLAFETAKSLKKVPRSNKINATKHEAMGQMDKSGKTKEDRETEQQMRTDPKAIDQAARLDPKINKNNLNSLKMASHRIGTTKNTAYTTVTDNIDAGTTKVIKTTTTQRGVIGFKELDFLSRDSEIEWVVLSEVDYSTQLMYAIKSSDHPKKLVKSGSKVFLDPMVFVKLVKLQKERNNIDLTVSFDRDSVKRGSSLNVLVANPANPDHNRSNGSSQYVDENSWRERTRSSSSGGNSVSTTGNRGSKKV